MRRLELDMEEFKVGDIVKLTNNPGDWRNRGDIICAIVTKPTYQNNPINMELSIVHRVSESGFIDCFTWICDRSYVLPYKIGIDGVPKSNFRWSKNV